MDEVCTAFVGGGAAAAALVTCAMNNHRLDALLDGGLVILEKQAHDSLYSSLGQYQIYSNSKAGAFVEFLDDAPASVRRALCDKPSTRRLLKHKQQEVMLRHIGAFIDDWIACIHAHINATALGKVSYQTCVDKIHLDAQSKITLEMTQTQNSETRKRKIRAQKLVLAAGAEQQLPHLLRQPLIAGSQLTLQEYADKVAPVDALLRRKDLSAALPPAEGDIVIIGGSHSAWSLVWRLCNDTTPKRNCIVMHRAACRVWYPNAASAKAHGSSPTAADICSATGQVNRLSGLRGPARDLHLSFAAGKLPNVRAIQLTECTNPDHIRQVLAQAAMIVPAFGYLKNLPPIIDASGAPIEFASVRDYPTINQHGQPLRKNGEAVKNIWFMGLSSGFKPTGKIGGEPAFNGSMDGIWLYQHDIGRQVLDGVLSHKKS